MISLNHSKNNHAPWKWNLIVIYVSASRRNNRVITILIILYYDLSRNEGVYIVLLCIGKQFFMIRDLLQRDETLLGLKFIFHFNSDKWRMLKGLLLSLVNGNCGRGCGHCLDCPPLPLKELWELKIWNFSEV